MTTGHHSASKEVEVSVQNAWLLLLSVLLSYPLGTAPNIAAADEDGGAPAGILGGVVLLLVVNFSVGGFTQQPKQFRMLILFGGYKGMVRKESCP